MNVFVIALIVIAIFSIVIFGFFMTGENPAIQFPRPEHYDIEITGLKDTYLIGEPYSFSYILSGYGSSCGSKMITFPINKTDNMTEGSSASCLKSNPIDFVLDVREVYGSSYGYVALQETGNYTVTVSFEKGTNGPTVAQKSFIVIEDNAEKHASNMELIDRTKDQSESKNSLQDTNSELVTPPLEVKVFGEKQVRRGTTHSIEIQVIRGSNPIEGASVFLDIEDYGENIIKEFKGFTDSHGYFVFSWEIPQRFDDVETLLAFIDVTDGISSKTELFKFQVYCLPGEQNCKAKGN